MKRFSTILFTVCLVLVLFCFLCQATFALDITFEWDANTEPDIGGYMVYYKFALTTDPGPSYDGVGADQGASPIDVGNVTEFKLTGLPDPADETERYFIVVTAYSLATNGSGDHFESDFSNEISGGVPTDPNLSVKEN